MHATCCLRDRRCRSFRLLPALLLSLAVFPLASGCGGKDPSLPDTSTVSGKVTYNGETLKEGTVMFHPQGGPGHPATGEIGENGIYTLTTYEGDDGAVPGNHIVTIQIFPKGANPGFEDQAPGYVPIPKKYTSAATSDLLVEVKPGPNTINLELKDEEKKKRK